MLWLNDMFLEQSKLSLLSKSMNLRLVVPSARLTQISKSHPIILLREKKNTENYFEIRISRARNLEKVLLVNKQNREKCFWEIHEMDSMENHKICSIKSKVLLRDTNQPKFCSRHDWVQNATPIKLTEFAIQLAMTLTA